jgi:hypothetical protein
MATSRRTVPAKMGILNGRYHGATATEPKMEKTGKLNVTSAFFRSIADAIGALLFRRSKVATLRSGKKLNATSVATTRSERRRLVANFR